MVICSSLTVNGLAINASAPFSKPRSLSSTSALEVRRITGTSLILGFCFTFLSKVIPSISGIITSEISKSYWSTSNACSASAPFDTILTLYHIPSSILIYRATSISSSATRILQSFLEWLFCTARDDSTASSISSGNRCSFPNWRETTNLLPCLPSLLGPATMLPWCISTSCLHKFKPMPVPPTLKPREFVPW